MSSYWNIERRNLWSLNLLRELELWNRLEYNLIKQIFKKKISGFAVGLKAVIVSLLFVF